MKCNCLTNTGSRTNVQITLRLKNKFLSRRLSVNSRLTRHTKKNYRSCSRVSREASQAHRRHRLRHTSWFMSLRDLTKERNLFGASQSLLMKKCTWTSKDIAQTLIKSVRGQQSSIYLIPKISHRHMTLDQGWFRFISLNRRNFNIVSRTPASATLFFCVQKKLPHEKSRTENDVAFSSQKLLMNSFVRLLSPTFYVCFSYTISLISNLADSQSSSKRKCLGVWLAVQFGLLLSRTHYRIVFGLQHIMFSMRTKEIPGDESRFSSRHSEERQKKAPKKKVKWEK